MEEKALLLALQLIATIGQLGPEAELDLVAAFPELEEAVLGPRNLRLAGLRKKRWPRLLRRGEPLGSAVFPLGALFAALEEGDFDGARWLLRGHREDFALLDALFDEHAPISFPTGNWNAQVGEFLDAAFDLAGYATRGDAPYPEVEPGEEPVEFRSDMWAWRLYKYLFEPNFDPAAANWLAERFDVNLGARAAYFEGPAKYSRLPLSALRWLAGRGWFGLRDASVREIFAAPRSRR
jgi:hypothetical protein